jgi:hypothetical protein
MSLHTLANHLQSAGRNGDSMLVHMTPGEVGGLQALAMANGGSLTINPKTGLPEAFFLAALLPTIAGMGLKAAGMSALGAALTVGAAGTLTSGSLRKGLMAGLGAFGGANFGGALAAKGAVAAAPTAAGTAINQMQSGILSSPMLTQGTNLAAAPAQAASTAAAAGGNALLPAGAGQMNLASGVGSPLTVPVSQPTFSSELGAMGRGFKKIVSDPKELGDFVKENPFESMSVLSALSQSTRRRSSGPEDEDVKPLEKYRYVYDSRPIGVAASRSSERDYFPNARYEPTGEYYAGGGLAALANGGTVEDMSRMNVVGANTGYPMANQMSSTYATPAERPISENIIHPQGDANIDPYTGEQKFADGGYTRYTGDDFYGEYDPKTDDYYYVPGTRAGSGYFMARDSGQGGGSGSGNWGLPGYEMAKGSEQGGAGGVGGSGKSGSSAGFFDPSYYNPKTGMYGEEKPAGPKPLSTKAVDQTRETLNPMYQKYFGRDIDEAGLATYTAKPFSEANLDTIFKNAPEYQTAEPLRAAKAQELAAKEREANLASAEQVSDAYQRVMGRAPDLGGLEYYAKTNRMTPEEVEKSLRGSDEYFKNLAKPFVPAITYGDKGMASIEGAPKYDPSQYGFAMGGGVSDLGAYSDGGRLLKGPGDGVSDSIPAVIGQRQPARLADGEFVIPARIVSELGNGSTDAGARKLYAMMNRIQSARKKSVGKGKVAANTKSEKYLPA